ncbi:hypothetical protein DD829_13390 [Chryseobacterium sp. HMWF035]|nr:hypothetical protein DBR25_20860 [Chryseobacterium sp. HMWF001]PVV55709.1 hypothetical protein DD829_13390 [Chryseobacterium sp. HMWF035]
MKTFPEYFWTAKILIKSDNQQDFHNDKSVIILIGFLRILKIKINKHNSDNQYFNLNKNSKV